MMMKRLAAATLLFFVTTIAAPPLATAQQAPGALSVPIAGTGSQRSAVGDQKELF